MSYTATKYLGVRPYPFPRGSDITQRRQIISGQLVDCDTATEYSVGGIGSSSFEVTAFSAVGLVTYSALKGAPLVNGQRVVIYNTASNTNDGTFIVSALTATTFIAVPLPGNALSGSAQTTQTAEGVGQIQWGARVLEAQTFTVTAVTFSAGVMTCTYTTLTGPQLTPSDKVLLAGMTNAGNNGQFTLTAVYPTSSTAGSFTVNNPGGVATDSGTGTGNFTAGSESASTTNETPIEVRIDSSKGYIYRWDYTNLTIRAFIAGAGSGTIVSTSTAPTITTSSGGVTTALGVAAGALSEVTGAAGITGVQAPTITSTFTGSGGGALSEAGLGATLAFDQTITFHAEFARTIAA